MVLAHSIEQNLRTQDVKITEDVTFDTMLLSTNTLLGLHESGFYKPSPIQLHGIPLGKCGFDLLLEAKSGTGKTAVFSVIALEKLNFENSLQVIILAPTREIAAQICDVIKQIGSGHNDLCVEVVMGGLPVQDDIEKFKKKTHIVVGSPGRLRHLIQDKHIDITAVRLLVLDEADKLMDKSFQADINYIFSILPKQKQVIMSSATYPEELKTVINRYVSNAQHICPDSTSILLGIKQLYTVVKKNNNIVSQTQHRFQELLKILSKKQFKQCLIFCNYQVRVAELSKMLIRDKWPAEQLHGQQEQTDRLEALKTLQQYKCRILVSTDLAARGIDASNVDLVINFEPPFEWQTYLHRIGRAGRFGSYGIAITILSEGQEQIKFKKTLESISVSLKLKNVWDDNESISEVSNETTNNIKTERDINPIVTTNNIINTELCNGLNENNFEQPEIVLSFADLNKSLEENHVCDIDTFSDLMISFKTDNNIADTIPYQHIEVHGVVNDKHDIDTVLLTDNIQEEVPSIAHNNKIDDIKLKISVSQKYDQCKNKNLQDSRFSQFKLKLKEKLKQKLHQQKYVEDEADSEYYDNTEELNNALIEAGLPTSFGSDKTNKHKTEYKKHTDKFNNRNSISHQIEKVEQVNHISKISANFKNNNTEVSENKTRTEHLNNNYLSNALEKLEETTHVISIQNCTDNKQIERCNNLHAHHKVNKVQNSATDSEIDEAFSKHDLNAIPSNSELYDSDTDTDSSESSEEETNSNVYEKYYNWYYQLKSHVKQIEMLSFIEELAKIK